MRHAETAQFANDCFRDLGGVGRDDPFGDASIVRIVGAGREVRQGWVRQHRPRLTIASMIHAAVAARSLSTESGRHRRPPLTPAPTLKGAVPAGGRRLLLGHCPSGIASGVT